MNFVDFHLLVSKRSTSPPTQCDLVPSHKPAHVNDDVLTIMPIMLISIMFANLIMMFHENKLTILSIMLIIMLIIMLMMMFQENKLTGPAALFAASGERIEFEYQDGVVHGPAKIRVF